MAEVASLTEIQEKWSIDDLFDALDILEWKAAVEYAAEEKARREAR